MTDYVEEANFQTLVANDQETKEGISFQFKYERHGLLTDRPTRELSMFLYIMASSLASLRNS